MYDKEIRNILITWLQTVFYEVRIYQEKSIGSSICDVMAVTDQLVGYEIKSDHDNYDRLKEQVKAYDRFFDQNWLVVSDKRRASAAESLLPSYWGILIISEDNVVVEHPAKSNQYVSRGAQLSILWKLELKNILIKSDLPLYAEKDKSYICRRITESVSSSVLIKDITRELRNRDYSAWDGIEGMDEDKEFPAREIIDVLSERNLNDYTLDRWIELYQKAKEVRESKEVTLHTEELERKPHAIPYTDIEVSLGAPWISPFIIVEFINWLLKIRLPIDHVNYEEITGNWHIANKDDYRYLNSNTESKYGLKKYNALYIMESTLNLREMRIKRSNGKYDEQSTVVALEKQKLIKQEFENWIWLDEDRCFEVEAAYNRMFSEYRPLKYDGSKLTFPEMNSQYELFPYQKDAVLRILNTPNTLLAYDVGAGKTYIMIAAAMTMRRKGLSRKNMFVVPNHIVGQWEKVFTDLYPHAKVLAIEPKGFKPEIRQKMLRQIRDGDYDGIIIAYSCFEQIPMTSETVLSNMHNKIMSIDNAIESLRYTVKANDGINTWTFHRWGVAPLKREKQYFMKLTTDFLESMEYTVKNGITFDELEINTLFVDEAHNYKNLPVRTHMKNLSGINTKGSKKCLDMLHKIRCVQNTNNGRGVVLATGTPLSNSISDAYTFQVYLQIEELERAHLDQFDNWVKTFAAPEQLFEIDVDASKFRMIYKFSSFHNLPELSAMFSQIAAFYAVDDLNNLPRLEGYTDTVIKRYPELMNYMKRLCVRTERIRFGNIARFKDNMLKVSTDGRKAALDLRLVDCNQPGGENSKIFRCVDNVISMYKRFPNTTQLIFCDYSTPKTNTFNVYHELKEQLCARGIPSAEIAFIHSYGTESKKLELYRKFNAVEMRILIGSTFKLGIGANVQLKLKAIHHLDVPWRPADMIQREGRMIRRGNENESVVIYRYISEGSFDSYAWQVLERKQRFISQFLSGVSYQRSVSDLDDNVLTYAEVKALAISEPMMKQLAEKENELRRLSILKAQEEESRKEMNAELSELEKKSQSLSRRQNRTRENAHYIKSLGESELKSEFETIRMLITEEVLIEQGKERLLGKVFEFKILLPQMQDEKKPYVLIERKGEQYQLPMGKSPQGNARRVFNYLKGFDKILKDVESQYQDSVRRRDDLKDHLGKIDNQLDSQISDCKRELEEIRATMILT